MKYLKLLIFCCIVFGFTNSFFIQVAFADYRGDVDLFYNRQKAGSSSNKTWVSGLYAKYYTDIVSAGDGPLSEASFLNPTSNVNLSFLTAVSDYSDTTSKMNQSSLGYEYIESSKRFGIAINVGHINYNMFGFKYYSNDWMLGLKYYLRKGQRISYSHAIESLGGAYTLNDKTKVDTISYSQLFNLGNNHFFHIGLNHQEERDSFKNNIYPVIVYRVNYITTTYYFSRFTGILLNLKYATYSDSSLENDKFLSVGFNRKVRQKFLVTFLYNYSSGFSAAVDSHTNGVTVWLTTLF